MADKLTRAERRELERLRLLVDRQRESIDRLHASLHPLLSQTAAAEVAMADIQDIIRWMRESKSAL